MVVPIFGRVATQVGQVKTLSVIENQNGEAVRVVPRHLDPVLFHPPPIHDVIVMLSEQFTEVKYSFLHELFL